jgi:hypothetical protein
MQLSKHHKILNEFGVGKCSVPMWSNGMPAGFCDAPAYGVQEPGQQRYGEYSAAWGKWFDGYCPGLACHDHGGPKSRVYKAGDVFCAVLPEFINLQESLAGFGDTPEAAREALKGQLSATKQ